MSDFYPVRRGGGVSSRLDRQVAQICNQINARAAVARHADHVQVERVTATTAYAMTAATHLAVVEASLATIAPHARDELRAIRIAGTIGLARVVTDAASGR